MAKHPPAPKVALPPGFETIAGEQLSKSLSLSQEADAPLRLAVQLDRTKCEKGFANVMGNELGKLVDTTRPYNSEKGRAYLEGPAQHVVDAVSQYGATCAQNLSQLGFLLASKERGA